MEGAAGRRRAVEMLRRVREDVIASVYIFGVIIVVLFISGLVAAPLLEGEPADPSSSDGDASPEERREAALDALEDLQFEHETGKLSDEDYRRLKGKYARAAVEARDRAAGGAGADAATTGSGESLPSGPDAAAGSEPEVDGAPARCPECGSEAGADARFCGQCGAELPA